MGMDLRASVRRWIPDDAHRSVWWLIVAIASIVSFAGLVATAAVLGALGDAAIGISLLRFLAINIVTFVIIVTAAGLYLSRSTRPLEGRRLIVFTVSLGLLAVAIRVALVPFTGIGGDPSLRRVSLAIQMVNVAIFTFDLLLALVYASIRERAVTNAYRELTNTRVSLAREEEAVRGRVFDDLHGSLQAQFVALGRELSNLADDTTDDAAAQRARLIEERLQRLYREEVGAINRTLYPRALEAGLRPALQSLEATLGESITLHITIDPVVAALDDPVSAGLHHDLRLGAYRIIEESVSNALRHSRATDIYVDISSTLVNSSPGLTCRVWHATREPAAIQPGSGISRMTARAHALGGDAQVHARKDSVEVTAELPLARPDAGRLSATQQQH